MISRDLAAWEGYQRFIPGKFDIATPVRHCAGRMIASISYER